MPRHDAGRSRAGGEVPPVTRHAAIRARIRRAAYGPSVRHQFPGKGASDTGDLAKARSAHHEGVRDAPMDGNGSTGVRWRGLTNPEVVVYTNTVLRERLRFPDVAVEFCVQPLYFLKP